MDLCGFCHEAIEPHEHRAPILGEPLHEECGLRMVIGSIAHLERRCGCYVEGSEQGDPPHMTLREAARAAVRAFGLQQARN